MKNRVAVIQVNPHARPLPCGDFCTQGDEETLDIDPRKIRPDRVFKNTVKGLALFTVQNDITLCYQSQDYSFPFGSCAVNCITEFSKRARRAPVKTTVHSTHDNHSECLERDRAPSKTNRANLGGDSWGFPVGTSGTLCFAQKQPRAQHSHRTLAMTGSIRVGSSM